MTLYTFHMCNAEGFSTCFEARDLPCEVAAFAVAGDLLLEHQSAVYVTVWDENQPVLSRYRDEPRFRAMKVTGPGGLSAARQ